MFISILLLVLSVNLDSIGVGLVYGIKKIYISLPYKLLICIISIFYSIISIYIGRAFSNFFSVNLGKYLGIIILLLLGLYSIFKAIYPNNSSVFNSMVTSIDIIKNSTNIDIDNSSNIDFKEAILLSFALSVDAISTSFAFSMLSINVLFIPFLIGIFQFVFFNIGFSLGKKITNLTYNKYINTKTISLAPGILLILIAILRI